MADHLTPRQREILDFIRNGMEASRVNFRACTRNQYRILSVHCREAIMGATIKEERIEIRLATAEKERIRQAAVLCHQNVSEFVLRAVRNMADETLAEQTRFVLPADQMAAFHAALDQPAKSIPRLRELLRKPSVFESR